MKRPPPEEAVFDTSLVFFRKHDDENPCRLLRVGWVLGAERHALVVVVDPKNLCLASSKLPKSCSP